MDAFQQKYDNRPTSLKDWDAHPILPNLFLGDFDAAQEPKAIEYFNIKAQLTILNKWERKCLDNNIITGNNINLKWIEWEDSFHETGSMQKHIMTAVTFIHEQLTQSNCVIVHCWAGVSRSSTMIIAYLMKHKEFSFSDAIQYTRDQRSKIWPNASFISELKLFRENGFELLPDTTNDKNEPTSDSIGKNDSGCSCLIL